jgi:hypothetical protein
LSVKAPGLSDVEQIPGKVSTAVATFRSDRLPPCRESCVSANAVVETWLKRGPAASTLTAAHWPDLPGPPRKQRGLCWTHSSTGVTEVENNGVFVLPGIGRLVRVDPPVENPVEAPSDGPKVWIEEIEVQPSKGAPTGTGSFNGSHTGVKTDWSVKDAENRELGRLEYPCLEQDWEPIGRHSSGMRRGAGGAQYPLPATPSSLIREVPNRSKHSGHGAV